MSVTIVRRNDIEMISEVMEDGEMHFLGELRDFRRHPKLAEFIPEVARLSVAWVRLGPGEVLAPHKHPVRTLLITTRGSGIVLGDVEARVDVGDSVLVYPGSWHGFQGGEPDGIEGLSVQFEVRGLYENVEEPLVKFKPTES